MFSIYDLGSDLAGFLIFCEMQNMHAAVIADCQRVVPPVSGIVFVVYDTYTDRAAFGFYFFTARNESNIVEPGKGEVSDLVGPLLFIQRIESVIIETIVIIIV